MKSGFLKNWKQSIKSRHKTLASWWDRRFHAFGPKDLEDTLAGMGISPGDTIFLHSSFDAFRGFSGKPSDVIGTLQNLVGSKGILMMPTMGFAGTAVEFAMKNPLVDIKLMPSRMGLITELFRRLPGVVRSLHPTHPIAVWGEEAKSVAANHYLATTPCGKPSPLQKLLGRDGKLLFLGTDFGVLTFYHTAEEILENQLPVKPFTEDTFHLQVRDQEGRIWDCTTRLYEPSVSKRRRLGRLQEELRRIGAWDERKIGRLRIGLTDAKNVLQSTKNLLDRGLCCYE